MSGPIRVLIVEDRPADAELMMYELRKAGFKPAGQRVDTESEYLARLGEPYGVERLVAAVRSRIAEQPEKLFQDLLAEIQQYSAVPQFADDVCLLGMEVARIG